MARFGLPAAGNARVTVRALVLTDLVDSTKVADQLGDVASAALWARHDRLARDLLAAHGGREIDKTDGFLLLFESAADGVAYALAYHGALRALDPPVRARVGLHVGPVILTENSAADVARGAKPLEVDGLAKPTAARIMGLATGGQTLLSADARTALGETRLRVESHGHWRMKGVSEPVELFEIGDEDAPFTPPPDAAKVYRVVRDGDLWLPVRQIRHNLPSERDAFVGRSADLITLADLVDQGAHLVSVLGMGGSGKTRLVTRFAWTWLGDYPGGAWFCDLSEARSAEGIVAAVARALDVPLAAGDPIGQLGHALAGRGRCLVVLDNFEQVARHAPETLGPWLDRASEATFVVTTREVMGLPGETLLALAPLVPEEAVALFVARAVQAKRDFVLAESDRPHVRALVQLLDALPLAIELAAARVRILPVRQLTERMRERFKLLTTTGARHARQATLRAALDWSWDLLGRDEQAALAQLSVFEGGFALADAEAVLSLLEVWPVDAVQGLVDKSLVRTIGDDRFDLLVSVQEYASEKLDTQGTRSDAEGRHGAHFAALGDDAAIDALDRHGGVARRQALAVDLDNLVIACRRAIVRGDGPVALGTLSAAWAVLQHRGPIPIAGTLAVAVAAMPTLSARDQVAVAIILGTSRWQLSDLAQANEAFEGAIAGALALGDRALEAAARGQQGLVYRDLGQGDAARAAFRAALDLRRELGRPRDGGLLANLAVLELEDGHFDAARTQYLEALEVLRAAGNRRFEGIVLGNLGLVFAREERNDEAVAHYELALAAHREVGNRRSEGIVLGNLGNLHQLAGRDAEGFAYLHAALAVAREVGARRSQDAVLLNLGVLHIRRGEPDRAVGLFEEALAISRELGEPRSIAMALGNLGTLHLNRGYPDLARPLLDASLAMHRSKNLFSDGLSWTLQALARLGAAEGRLDAALAHAEEAVTAAEPFPGVHATAVALLAELRGEPPLPASSHG